MESLFNFVCTNADHAHFFLFGLLMLAGLNIPISEDLILLIGGVLAATCVPENTLTLFVWIYLGCIFSAWEAYLIGRKLGPYIYEVKIFRMHLLTRTHTEKLFHYYEKYGIWTFVIGRFVPGGVRNALFMTAGLGKMPFLIFVRRDCLACLLSSSTLFSLGYIFGQNKESLFAYFADYQKGAGFLLLSIFGLIIGRILYRNFFRGQ